MRLATARDGSLPVVRRFLGRVEARLAAQLALGVAGPVVEVVGREGDAVKAGDVLVRLDEGLIRPRIDAARAEIRRLEVETRLARSERGRAANLAEPVVTAAERERFETRVGVLEAQLGTARAQLKALEAELERHRLLAPWDGIVQGRLVDPGTWVQPGQVAMALLGTEPPEILVDVSADVASAAVVGARLTVLGEPTGEAEIAGVVPALDTTTRTMRLRLKPLFESAWLIPGRQVDIEIRAEERAEGAVLVPRDALKRGPASTRLWVAEDDAAGGLKPRLVTVDVLGTNDVDALVKAEGLVPGVRVVTEGNERLRPGQAIKPLEAAVPDAGGGR